MTRSESTAKNLKYAMIGQTIGLLASFVSRLVFTQILSSEYLGLNGLFTNLLTVLSFAELGFGTAITYSLYQPLANQNQEEIKSLMYLFRKIYTFVGCFIIIAGICMTPFLHIFIKDMPDIEGIRFIFLLFVINTAISYFFSYKRTLVIADQNRYIATFYRYFFYFLLQIAQTIILVLTRNYFFYLYIQIMITFLENYFVSKSADRFYPYLKDTNILPLPYNKKREIYKNTRAMMMHKIGGIIVNSTDNIIISMYVGLRTVGLYSNYYMVKSSLELITGQLFSSVSASIGNLCASEKIEKQYHMFRILDFIGFWVFTFCSISFYMLIHPFIELWLGNNYLLDGNASLYLVIIFYLNGLRQSVLTYRQALGLFYYDRYKPLVEVVVNLVCSIFLAKLIGLDGVLLGTIISLLFVAILWEVAVLYSYGFHMKIKNYMIRYISHIIITVFSFVLVSLFSKVISLENVYIDFIEKAILCFIIPNLMIYSLYRDSFEMKYIINIFRKKINVILQRNGNRDK